MSAPRKYKNIGHPLVRLMEEAGELTQAAAKIARFGIGATNPDEVGGPTNLKRLISEKEDLDRAWNDLVATVAMDPLNPQILEGPK